MDVAKHNSTRPESGAPILAPLTKGRTLEGWWVMLSASEESRRQPHTGLLRARLFGRRSGLLAWYYAQPLLSALQSVTILLRALPGQGRPAYLF